GTSPTCSATWAYASPNHLVPEVPHAREHHRDAGFVGGIDDVLVLDRAARLDDRRGAGFDGGEHAVGEGEEGVGRHYRTLGQGAVDPGRLSGVDRLAVCHPA